MYIIKSADWHEVAPLWEQWRTYNLDNPEPTIEIQPPITNVFVDLKDIAKFDAEKTFVMTSDGEILGCLQVKDFTVETLASGVSVCGIQNVAVRHDLRDNGIGRRLMDVADYYIKENQYDLSILYSSLYATKRNFYEKFGYDRHEEIFDFNGKQKQAHLKYYGYVGLPMDKLNSLIRSVGKF